MKVGIYTSRVDAPDNGPGIYRENLVSHLPSVVSTDDQIDLIHYESSNQPIYEDFTEIKLKKRLGLSSAVGNLINKWLGWEMDIGEDFSPLTELRAGASKYDLLHFQLAPPRPFWLFTGDAKLVTTFHFGVRPILHPSFYSITERKAVEYFIPKILNKFDAIITVSEYSKKLHSELLDIPENKFYVTHNAPPTTISKEKDEEVLQKYELSSDYIFHLSNNKYYKNPKGIVRGFEIAKKEYGLNADLVIAGGGWRTQDILPHLTNKKTMESIEVLGFVPRQELATLYTCAKLFFLPSLSEGFPFVLLESLNCGTNVLTTKGYGLPDIFGEAGSYIPNVESNQCIAKSLADSYQDEEISRSAISNVCCEYNWESTAKKTYNIYNELLD